MESKQEINKTAYQIKFTKGYSRTSNRSFMTDNLKEYLWKLAGKKFPNDDDKRKAEYKTECGKFRGKLVMKNFEAVPHDIILKSLENAVAIDIQPHVRSMYIIADDNGNFDEKKLDELRNKLANDGFEYDLHEFYTVTKVKKQKQSDKQKAITAFEKLTPAEKAELLKVLKS